jgi:hypothetical protein
LRKLILVVCVLLVGSFLTTNALADKIAEKKAKSISKAWLELIDGEKYSQSWGETSKYFRGLITKDKWKNQMNAARKPFGKRLSRVFESSKFTSTLPGAPDGKYVVIEYVSSFKNKRAAVETVTSMLDKDGKWRVSGYFIK